MLEKNLRDLKEDLLQGKQIVLFLGAGVNFSQGKKLMWTDLLNFLFNHAIAMLNATTNDISIVRDVFTDNDISDTSYNEIRLKQHIQAQQEFPDEVKASVIKQLLGDSYIPLLQNFLYEKCNWAVLKDACADYVNDKQKSKPFHTLFSVAELILRYENIKAVVTYNYDYFLSEAIMLLQQQKQYFDEDLSRLNSSAFKPIEVYQGWKDEPFTNKGFLIYHIHGAIQPPDRMAPNNKNQVVLSLEEIYDMAKDVYAWQTTTQLYFLSHYSSVFIGTSLSDMTMKRMIHYANIERSSENVYYLTAKISDDVYVNTLQRLKNSYHTMNGLKVVYDEEGYEHLFNTIKDEKWKM